MNQDKQQQLFADAAADELEHGRMLPWDEAAERDKLCAEVVFNLPLNKVFHYLIPDELRAQVRPGVRLKAPFGRGNQMAIGYCVGVMRPAAEQSSEHVDQLKTIYDVLDDAPLLSAKMLELTQWIADYYLCGWGQVLETVVPAGVKNQAGTRLVTLLEATEEARNGVSTFQLPGKQASALERLCASNEPMSPEELSRAAACGIGPINALRKKGLIRAIRRRAGNFKLPAHDETAQADLRLNSDQQAALNRMLEAVRSGEHRTMLLHGVTGSGKTEVYIQAIREIVSYGRQAIVLVPEISLTPQTIRRFQKRFDTVAVLHSHLSDAERHWHWQQIAEGRIQVVVGARSAVFAPTPHLGLIVIDEEHETSFKQDNVPRYHAREVARRRAELERIPLVLGSATPTLESWHRARSGDDLLLKLPRRVEGLPLPPVVVVDVRNDPECRGGAAIGRALRGAIQANLESGGQVILFLNLRGYSPVLWCRACGSAVKCPHCDIALSWHKDLRQALCHECDYRTEPPAHCPECGHSGLRYLGTGTQRLEQEIRAKFPLYPCVRMDSDAMRKPGSHHQALERFRKGEARILLGTQMIAKGLDFPNVTLVGVTNADTTLHQPDFRASERTFHLISQVAGRTGRGNQGGRVLVQSVCPGEVAIVMASEHDFDGFATQELAHRQEMQTPPFQRLTRVILRGSDEDAVREESRKMAELLRNVATESASPVRILGPAPATIAKLKDLYRYHFQLSAPTIESIHELWKNVADKLPKTKDVEFVIDVDPINMR